MKSEEKQESEEQARLREGYRKANQAALFANFRRWLVWAFDKEDPAVGLHGVLIMESQKAYLLSVGSTPEPATLFGHLGSLHGSVLTSFVNRKIGDMKAAQSGDVFDPKTGKAHCVGCEDGDPTGEHAKEELKLNAKAWLGAVLLVAHGFYGEYLSERASEALRVLKEESFPADENVS